MADYAYKNLKEPKNVASGIAEFALLAPFSWFDADGIKAPAAPFTNPGDEITVKTAHVFLATKGFMKFTLAPQKNELEIKARGDIGLNGQNQEVKIFIPGSYIEVHEQVKHLMNVPLIALVKDSNSQANLFYQLGNDSQAAYLKADFSTGTTKDGVKGYTATITYDDGPLFYSAAIEYLA